MCPLELGKLNGLAPPLEIWKTRGSGQEQLWNLRSTHTHSCPQRVMRFTFSWSRCEPQMREPAWSPRRPSGNIPETLNMSSRGMDWPKTRSWVGSGQLKEKPCLSQESWSQMGPAGKPLKSPQSGQVIISFKHLPGPESWSWLHIVPVQVKKSLSRSFPLFSHVSNLQHFALAASTLARRWQVEREDRTPSPTATAQSKNRSQTGQERRSDTLTFKLWWWSKIGHTDFWMQTTFVI